MLRFILALRSSLRFVAFLTALTIGSRVIASDPSGTQTLVLRAGWNAVWLGVEPKVNAPEALFAGTPVTAVAAYNAPLSPTEYLASPDEQPWNLPGWAVWYPSTQETGFLTTLFALHGGNAYLIRSQSDTTVVVSGSARLHRFGWKPNSFNLVGFPVDPASPPTFARFFEGSSAHPLARIFQLLDGVWQPVNASTPIESGRAYWVWCVGGSSYQGPLALTVPGGNLILGTDTFNARLVLANATSTTLGVNLRLRAPAPLSLKPENQGDALPLSQPVSRTLLGGEDEVLVLRLDTRSGADFTPGVLEVRTSGGCLWTVPLASKSGP